MTDGSDAITTEVVRHSLHSAAEQIRRALMRTAFSPIIYDVLDFAVAIYDRDKRLLSQAPGLPNFLGTMGYCVEGAVEAVGEEGLVDGDIILINYPYVTGSHQEDMAVVCPVFLNAGELVGYTAVKAHFLDIGAKDYFCSDTTDYFQEGTVFPGVKLYRAGELQGDIARMVTANSRVPRTSPETSTPRSLEPAPAPPRCDGWLAGMASRPSTPPSRRCTTVARRRCASSSPRSRTGPTLATVRWTATESARAGSRSNWG